MNIDFTTIIGLILYIIPGYLTLFVVNIMIDYPFEEKQLEKIIQYLFISGICYVIAITLLIVILGSIDVIWSLHTSYFLKEIFGKNLIYLAVLAMFVSPFLGMFLALFYFGKGYPYNHFKRHTTKIYFKSLFSKLFQDEFRKGCWVSIHLKNGNILNGQVINYDCDEERRDYFISLINVGEYNSKLKPLKKLKGEKIVINLKNAEYIEFHK